MLWFCRKMTSIGVDAGSRTIKAAQLTRTREGFKLHAAAVFPLERPNKIFDADAAGRFRQMLENQGFEGRRIVLSTKGGEQAEVFKEAGFNLKAVDQPIAALSRACVSGINLHNDEQPTAVIADLGWLGGAFAVTHGREIRFQQPLECAGMGAAHSAIVDRFGLGDEISEGLLREVYVDFASSKAPPESVHAGWTRVMLMRRLGELTAEMADALAHVRQRYPIRPTRLFLTGGGAQSRGLDSYFADRLGIDVVICRPSSLVNCNGTAQALAQSPALVQAIGLARWEA